MRSEEREEGEKSCHAPTRKYLIPAASMQDYYENFLKITQPGNPGEQGGGDSEQTLYTVAHPGRPGVRSGDDSAI